MGKKQNLFMNAIWLTITALIMRTIGIIFKVYISNEIGAEGMGVYRLITTVYMMALTFAISGISMAVTRIVSEEVGKRAYQNIKSILFKAILISMLLSLVVSIFTFTFARYIAINILKDPRTLLAIRIMAISIPFVAVASSIKGYFYAIRDVFVPVTSQIIEQLLKITVVVALLNLVIPMGLEYSCAVLVLATVISDIISCIYVSIIYKLELKEKSYGTVVNLNGIVKRLVSIAAPIAGSSYVSAGFRTIETILIPIGLIKFGMSNKEAVSVLGGVLGMIFPIIMYPAALLMSVGTILMPEVSRARAGNNNDRVLSLINRTIGFTLVIGILVFFILNTFGRELGLALYKNIAIGELFTIFSFVVPFMYIDMIIDGILKGLNQQVKSFQYDLMESVIRVLLIYVLLPIKGLNGFIITLFISVAFSVSLGFIRMIKVTKIKIDLINWAIKPIIIGGIATVLAKLIFKGITDSIASSSILLTIVILSMIIIYFIGLKLVKGIRFKDN